MSSATSAARTWPFPAKALESKPLPEDAGAGNWSQWAVGANFKVFRHGQGSTSAVKILELHPSKAVALEKACKKIEKEQGLLLERHAKLQKQLEENLDLLSAEKERELALKKNKA